MCDQSVPFCQKSWRGHNRQGRNGPATHGVNVAQSVGSSDLAEMVGRAHDRSEEIHGLDKGKIIGEAIDSGVVIGVKADEHVGIALPWQTAQHGAKRPGSELCGTRAAFAVAVNLTLSDTFPSRFLVRHDYSGKCG